MNKINEYRNKSMDINRSNVQRMYDLEQYIDNLIDKACIDGYHRIHIPISPEENMPTVESVLIGKLNDRGFGCSLEANMLTISWDYNCNYMQYPPNNGRKC